MAGSRFEPAMLLIAPLVGKADTTSVDTEKLGRRRGMDASTVDGRAARLSQAGDLLDRTADDRGPDPGQSLGEF